MSSDPNYFNRVQFLCSRDREPFTICGYGKNHGLFVDGVFASLAPDEAHEQEELLFCRHLESFDGKKLVSAGLGFAFSRAGNYRIKAESRGLVSNVVQIEVRSPSAAEKAAAKAFTQPRVAAFLQRLWVPPHEKDAAIAEIEQLLAKYHNSPFADHAHYTLAQVLWPQYAKRPNPKTAQRAYNHFRAVTNRLPGLRILAAYRQASIASKLPALPPREDFVKLKGELLPTESERDLSIEMSYFLRTARKHVWWSEIRYADDPRLDKMIEYRFTKGKPLEDVFRQLSTASGVELDADPSMKTRTIQTTSQRSGTLREFLRRVPGWTSDGYWKPRGDGYVYIIDRKGEEAKE